MEGSGQGGKNKQVSFKKGEEKKQGGIARMKYGEEDLFRVDRHLKTQKSTQSYYEGTLSLDLYIILLSSFPSLVATGLVEKRDIENTKSLPTCGNLAHALLSIAFDC